MFRTLRKKTDPDDEPAPVSSAVQMALAVRLKIFAVEEVEPAATEFLSEFSERLDNVRARRHAVDFEAAKARAWWEGQRTSELVASGHAALAVDAEIQRLIAEQEIVTIVFDRYAEEALRKLIQERFSDIALRMRILRNNRLNVQ